METVAFEVPNVSMLFADVEPGLPVPVFRDRAGTLIEPLTDFCDHILKEYRESARGGKAYNTRLEHLAYYMREFAVYVCERDVDWQNLQSPVDVKLSSRPVRHWLDIDNDFIVAFRDWALLRTMRNKRYRGSVRKAQRTVNIKLRLVYAFFTWAQVDAEFAPNLIGWTKGYLIRSTLPASKQSNNPLDRFEVTKYPKCYRFTGTKSRTSDAQHWASSDDVLMLERFFLERRKPLIAERNILLLRLGEYVGWRCESANSLTVDLFSDEAISAQEKTGREDFLVIPPKQKNAHNFAFPVEWELAYAINAYVGKKGGRKQLLEALGASEKNTEGRIFVSGRSGHPLTDRALSQEFGTAFRHIGAPKGSGYHALRRGMMEQFGERRLEARKAAGASVAAEDVMLDYVAKLGHASAGSIESYRRASTKNLKTTVADRQQQELIAKDMENAQLQAKLARLQDSLAEKKSSAGRRRTNSTGPRKRKAALAR